MTTNNISTRGLYDPDLPLEDPPVEDGDKAELVAYTLKTKAGGRVNDPTYKISVRRFDNGTPAELITALKKMEEIWHQNSIGGGADRVGVVRSILRGEALTIFEGSIAAHLPDPPVDEITQALEAVKAGTFSHRALEYQKTYMRRRMKKPAYMSFRNMAAAVTRLNDHLPYFPNGNVLSKFSDVELLELLEWSIPQAWRTKFDSDRFIPTQQTKLVFINACEAIERSEALKKNPRINKASKAKIKGGKRTSAKNKRYSSNPSNNFRFTCSHCGKNPTHNSVDCYILKRRNNSNNGNAVKDKNLSAKNFRKEVNSLNKKKRAALLQGYAAVIKDEQKKKKNSKNNPKKSRKVINDSDVSGSESESDSSLENHVMEVVPAAETSTTKTVSFNLESARIPRKKATQKAYKKPKTVASGTKPTTKQKNCVERTGVADDPIFVAEDDASDVDEDISDDVDDDIMDDVDDDEDMSEDNVAEDSKFPALENEEIFELKKTKKSKKVSATKKTKKFATLEELSEDDSTVSSIKSVDDKLQNLGIESEE